jgi:hypothetical protein
MSQPNWGANQGSTAAGYCNPADLLGQAAAVWVIQHIADAGPTSNTKPGDRTDAIQVDVVKLDPANPAASPLYRTQVWRSGRVIAALKPFAGSADPCLITFYDETPGNMTTRRPRFIGDDPKAVELAQAWYSTLGEAGFLPSAKQPYVVAQQQQQPGPQQQHYGWPQGAVPAQQYQQQGPPAGYGAPQPPQQQQWGAPQQAAPVQPQQQQWGPPVQQQWGAPQQAAQSQPQQWGAPQQQPQQWGAPQPQQAPAAQQQWGAPQQQPQQWGAPQQAAPVQQQPQWGAPPQQAPAAQPPPQQSVLDMIKNGGQGTPPSQETPPF